MTAAFDRLTTLLQVRPGELRKVALVAILFTVIELGRSAGGSAADTLFFLRFGVDNLPYMFIALGVTNFVFSLTYAVFLGRLPKGRFFVLLLAIMACCLLLERAALVLELRALYPVLWLTVNIIGALLGTLMWNTAGEVCDARQAKRLFPLFVSAGLLGGLLGSVVIGPIARWFGTANLLVLVAILLVIAGLLMRTIAREFFARLMHEDSDFLTDVRAGYDVVRRSPMLQLLAISAVLFSVLYFSVSFPFGQAVSAAFPQEADLAAFLGLFNGVCGILTFLVSLFVANRLYARIGVVNALLLLPLTYLSGFILFAINFALSTAVVIRLSQLLVLSGIGDGAYGAFFNVVPVEKRAQVRAFDSGVPSQVGTMLSGILLILGAHVLSTTQIFIMGVLVASACAFVIWHMRNRYADALIAALQAGRIEVFSEGNLAFSGIQNNASAVQVVSAALRDPKATTRRLAVEMLARMNARASIPSLLPLLADSDAPTRCAAIHALGEFQAQETLQPIANLSADPDPVVRISVLETLSKLAPKAQSPVSLTPTLKSMLEDTDRHVQVATARVLIDINHDPDALAIIGSALQDADPATRILALKALAPLVESLVVDFNIGQLLHALDDSSPAVRRAACEALNGAYQSEAQEALLKCLDDADSGVRMAAAAALKTIGEKATPKVFSVLESGSFRARDAALAALDVQPSSQPLRKYAQHELAELRNWQALLDAIPMTGSAPKLLHESITAYVNQTKQRLVTVIGLLGTPDAMALVGKSLQARDKQTQATAVEVLDTLGDKQLVRQLIPLVEGSTAERSEAIPIETALSRLLQMDNWLCALAIRSIGEIGLHSFIPGVRPFVDSNDTLVSEAASDTLRMLGEGDSVKTLQTVSLMERILFLRDVPLFADLSPDDLKQIADVADENLYPAGSILCKEGDPGHEMFIIVSGNVRILKTDGLAEKLIATRSVGDFIGEMAIIEAGPRFTTAQADGETRTLVIAEDTFKSILRERPDVSFAVLRTLSRRLREK